ncbi:MAG: DUF2786 domain-containing protein, partial [Deltaproteobacteria bacterium]|nr:DUF2786 domain-containing protein [Deltaproteobacteria bacterium]
MSETWDKLVPGGGSPGTGRPPRTELQDLRRPAAQQLAELVRLPFGQGVRLPPAFARAAVERFFMSKFRYKVAVIEGPCGPEQTGRPLAEGEWALLIPELFRSSVRPLVGGSPVHTLTGRVHVYPRHAVQLEPRYVRWLLVALEKVKPEELDAEGLPYPWVPPTARTERLGGGDPDEADVEIVPAAAALPPLEPAVPVTTPPTFPDERIRAWFDELSRLAGFPGLALHLVRGADNKLGFTAGRIWLDRRLGPLRVRLVTCPNADPAEIQSTIVHELGHALSRGPGHSEAFKLAMIGLAARRWGDRWFAEAQAQAGERYALVDRWVACGIRAAERTEGVPPALRDTADEQLLRVVTRIRRLRELAADQQGLPEAIAATAMANDLVVLHGLSQHGVRVAAVDEDQLCDRWILIKGDGV